MGLEPPWIEPPSACARRVRVRPADNSHVASLARCRETEVVSRVA